MRIAVVMPGFARDDQDWCVPPITEWVRQLARLHDVEVFAVQHPAAGTWRAHGVLVTSCGRSGPASGLRAVPAVVAAIRAAHRRAPFDAIHAMWAEESGLAAVIAGRALGVTAIVTVSGVELAGPAEIPGRRAWRQRLARRVVAAADRVIAPSRWLADRVPGGAEVVPFVVDAARFAPLGPRTGARLLCVAALVPVKGHDVLLHAFARVRRAVPHATLDLVGEGPERPRIVALAGRLGVDVALRGAIAYEQMPAIYADADVLVQASRWESHGVAVSEALACGLTVVSTAVGYAADRPDRVRTVAVDDAEALASAVIADLSTPRPPAPARPRG